jgi:hypothetical protein
MRHDATHARLHQRCVQRLVAGTGRLWRRGLWVAATGAALPGAAPGRGHSKHSARACGCVCVCCARRDGDRGAAVLPIIPLLYRLPFESMASARGLFRGERARMRRDEFPLPARAGWRPFRKELVSFRSPFSETLRLPGCRQPLLDRRLPPSFLQPRRPGDEAIPCHDSRLMRR